MVKESGDNSYKFVIKGVEFEVYYTEDGAVELYETKDPGKTGFIFQNIKSLNLFVNSLTDVITFHKEKEGGIV